MSTKVLAVNAGSSSLKFKLYQMPEEKVLCSGMAERIGHDDGIFTIKHRDQKVRTIVPLRDHAVAVELLLKGLLDEKIINSLDEIGGIGHRVVHGGKYFNSSAIFDDDTESKIESLLDLAPLHNKPNLVGYRAFKKALPNVGHVAIFDTSFHQTMAPQDYLYPIPYEYFEKYDIRRYGFHGTSHQYLAQESQKYLQGIEDSKVIICHLGSGASISAVKNGKCVATSMGLTPLGGIMMGTRTGDMDPSVMVFACQKTGKTMEEMYDIFNKKSGILGISGISNDTRDIEKAVEEGNERAILTNQLFVRRIVDFIGQYFVRLGGADLIVFSAGIGENVGYYRQMILDQLIAPFGLKIDTVKNLPLREKEALISLPESKVKVAIIPTDEEIMIARDTVALLHL